MSSKSESKQTSNKPELKNIVLVDDDEFEEFTTKDAAFKVQNEQSDEQVEHTRKALNNCCF